MFDTLSSCCSENKVSCEGHGGLSFLLKIFFFRGNSSGIYRWDSQNLSSVLVNLRINHSLIKPILSLKCCILTAFFFSGNEGKKRGKDVGKAGINLVHSAKTSEQAASWQLTDQFDSKGLQRLTVKQACIMTMRTLWLVSAVVLLAGLVAASTLPPSLNENLKSIIDLAEEFNRTFNQVRAQQLIAALPH